MNPTVLMVFCNRRLKDFLPWRNVHVIILRVEMTAARMDLLASHGWG